VKKQLHKNFSLMMTFERSKHIALNDICLILLPVNYIIIAAVKNIDAPMLMRVWQELEHGIDVCRVTRGVHIEFL
jgi:hypothetical protein